MKKILFVAHCSIGDSSSNVFSSPAGDNVQKFMIQSIVNLGYEVEVVSMEPMASWPKGPLIRCGVVSENRHSPMFLNIFIIKHLFFSFYILRLLLKKKYDFIFQYNSYLFENIVSVLFAKFYKLDTIMCLQDVKIGSLFSFFSIIQDVLSLNFAKKYKVIIAISKEVANLVQHKFNRVVVFQGGLTESGVKLMECREGSLDDIAVFAGSIERYNGVDRLIAFWKKHKVKTVLHVFGRGSIEEALKREAANCENIVFHGFRDENTILSYYVRSKFNLCFRYSDGIDERYFFPSKFFNLAAAPGLLLMNKFQNNPFCEKYGAINDMSVDLLEMLNSSNDLILQSRQERISYLKKHSDWSIIISEVLNK